MKRLNLGFNSKHLFQSARSYTGSLFDDMVIILFRLLIPTIQVRIFNSIKAWRHEREESVPLNHNGDLDLREVDRLLGYTGQSICQVSEGLAMH